MTGLFHGAAEAGRVRDACMTARSLVQIAELVAKIADAIPHPPTAPVQSLFGALPGGPGARLKQHLDSLFDERLRAGGFDRGEHAEPVRHVRRDVDADVLAPLAGGRPGAARRRGRLQ